MVQTKLLQHWYDEVWNKGNENVIDEMLHDEAIIHGLKTDSTKSGAEAFKPFYKSFREGFPSVHIELEPIFSDGEFEAAYCHVTAKNSEGKEGLFTGITIAKFRDGQLVEGWNGFDFLSMYQQVEFKLMKEDL